eukprot:gene31792-38431_t
MGGWLTPPEIDLVKFMEGERSKRQKILDERKIEQAMLANSVKTAAVRTEALRAAHESQYREEVNTTPAKATTATPEKKEKDVLSGSKPRVKSEGNIASRDIGAESKLSSPSEAPPTSSSPSGTSATKPANPTPAPAVIRPIQKRKIEEDDEVTGSAASVQKYFTAEGMLLEGEGWASNTASTQPLTLSLDGFSMEGKNTFAIAYTANLKSIGWAFNLSSEHDEEMSDVFLHFNPRYVGTKANAEGVRPWVRTLQMTDRQGTWGSGKPIKLPPNHSLLEGEGTLVVNIHSQGFLIHHNNEFIAFFPHRRDVSRETAFKLHFLPEDDNGNAYDVTLRKVWWGREHLNAQVLS